MMKQSDKHERRRKKKFSYYNTSLFPFKFILGDRKVPLIEEPQDVKTEAAVLRVVIVRAPHSELWRAE